MAKELAFINTTIPTSTKYGVTREGGRGTHGVKASSNGAAKEVEYIKGPLAPVITHEGKRKVGVYEVVGNVKESGAVAREANGDVVAAVRSPQWVRTDPEKNRPVRPTWGGEQTTTQVEISFLRTFGTERAAQVARRMIDAARHSVKLPDHASTQGHEVESILTEAGTGKIMAAPHEEQEELQAGVWEKALKPKGTVEGAMWERALHSRIAIERWGSEGKLPVNTSVPISGNPEDDGLQINSGKYIHYVAGMSEKLKNTMGRHDDISGQVGDAVALKYGYPNLETMVSQEDTISY